MDGVGEWSTSTIGHGRGNKIELLSELRFPHSLGMLYSAFTYFTGFKVNSGEYKLMGLAPYGQPRYVQRIYDELLDLREDGSFAINLAYFDYLGNLRMTNDAFARLFGGAPRSQDLQSTVDPGSAAHYAARRRSALHPGNAVKQPQLATRRADL